MTNHGFINITPLLNWETGKANAKLSEYYDATLTNTDDTINWYWKAKKTQRIAAKAIRIVATILFVLSTLVPYFANYYNKTNINFLYLGYVFAGLGAGLLLLDKFSGFSTSWVRYILLGQQLQFLRNNFVQQWQIARLRDEPLTLKRFEAAITLLITFQSDCNEVIKAETQAWAKEFQDNLTALLNSINAQSATLKSKIDQQQAAQQTITGNTLTTGNNVPPEVIEEAVRQNYDDWQKNLGIISAGSGKKLVNGQPTDINCIVFNPIDKLSRDQHTFQPIPTTIHFRSVNGHEYDIPTDVVAVGGEIKGAAKLLCDNMRPKRPGCSVSRADHHATGTIGLIVYRQQQPYLLSCYHVLCAPELDQQVFTVIDDGNLHGNVASPGLDDDPNGDQIANMVMGDLTEDFDCALAKIGNPFDVTERICSIDHAPTYLLTLTDDHVKSHFRLTSVGRTSGVIRGQVQSIFTTATITYEIGQQKLNKKLTGLICTNQPADGGDSGAPVFSDDNEIVGILIATTTQYSYIVPIQRILTKYTLTLKPTNT